MTYLLSITTVYKMGHQKLKSSMSIIGRNVVYIERVPEEVPEYSDGALTRVQVSSGQAFFCADTYDDLIARWEGTLGEL
jgi:hypothetical protein